MLSIVPEAAPDLADSSLIVVPRLTRWFEARPFDDQALDRLDKPVVRTPHQVLAEALLEPSSADLAWLAGGGGSPSVVVARDRRSPLPPSPIGGFPGPPPPPVAVKPAPPSGA